MRTTLSISFSLYKLLVHPFICIYIQGPIISPRKHYGVCYTSVIPLARCLMSRDSRLVWPGPSWSSSMVGPIDSRLRRFTLSKRGPVSRGNSPPDSTAPPPSPEITVGTRLLRNSMCVVRHFHSSCTANKPRPFIFSQEMTPVIQHYSIHQRLQHPHKRKRYIFYTFPQKWRTFPWSISVQSSLTSTRPEHISHIQRKDDPPVVSIATRRRRRRRRQVQVRSGTGTPHCYVSHSPAVFTVCSLRLRRTLSCYLHVRRGQTGWENKQKTQAQGFLWGDDVMVVGGVAQVGCQALSGRGQDMFDRR